MLIDPDPEENEFLVDVEEVTAAYRIESNFPQVRILHVLALVMKWVKVVTAQGKTRRLSLKLTSQGKSWLKQAAPEQFDQLLVGWLNILDWSTIFNYSSLATDFSTHRLAFYQDTLSIYLSRLAEKEDFVSFKELANFSSFDMEELTTVWLLPFVLEREVFLPLIRAGLIVAKYPKQVGEQSTSLKGWDKLIQKKRHQAYRLTPLGEVVVAALTQSLRELLPEEILSLANGL